MLLCCSRFWVISALWGWLHVINLSSFFFFLEGRHVMIVHPSVRLRWIWIYLFFLHIQTTNWREIRLLRQYYLLAGETLGLGSLTSHSVALHYPGRSPSQWAWMHNAALSYPILNGYRRWLSDYLLNYKCWLLLLLACSCVLTRSVMTLSAMMQLWS